MHRCLILLVLTASFVMACDGPKQSSTQTTKSKAIQPVAKKAGATKVKSSKDKKSFVFAKKVHEAKVGQPAKVTLEVKPGSGYKLNPEYPWKAKLVASQALGVQAGTMAKDKWTMDASSATLPLDVKPATAGEHKLTATVNLSVCESGGQKKCLWFTDEPVEVAVKAAK